MPDLRPAEKCTPYIGLRNFEEEDRRFFKGRRSQTDDVLDRLAGRRFLAIAGPSGGGKSSLVLAGVVPSLRAERLRGATSEWITVVMRPAGSPFRRLHDAICESFQKHAEANGEDLKNFERWKRRLTKNFDAHSTLDLTNIVREAAFTSQPNVLLVVDQFEELFRYEPVSKKGEAEAFIAELLHATSNDLADEKAAVGLMEAIKLQRLLAKESKDEAISGRIRPINERVAELVSLLKADAAGGSNSPSPGKVYAIVTIRSDYFGECAKYPGLAEAVNNGLYLIPRLSRQELEQAIQLPALECRGSIDPELTNLLANDVAAAGQDQLPLMQHALLRCWKTTTKPSEKTYTDEGGPKILNNHLDAVLRDVDENIAKRLFKRLTRVGNLEHIDPDNLAKAGVRDSAALRDLIRQTGFTKEALTHVIDAFRGPQRWFLRPSMKEEKDLQEETLIDITHESLIRNWHRMTDWLKEEYDAKNAYLELVAEARKERDKPDDKKRILPRGRVESCNKLIEDGDWTAPWAERYGSSSDYSEAITYLNFCKGRHAAEEAKKDEERKRQAERKIAAFRRTFMGVTLTFVVAGLAWYFWSSNQRKQQREFKRFVEQVRAARQTVGVSDQMQDRVPAAVASAYIAKEFKGTLWAQEEQELPVEDWELFSALRKPDVAPFDAEKRPETLEREYLGSQSLAVSDGRVVAFTDGSHIHVCTFENCLQTAAQNDTWTKMPFENAWTVSLKGNVLLAAKTYAPTDPNTEVQVFRLDRKENHPKNICQNCGKPKKTREGAISEAISAAALVDERSFVAATTDGHVYLYDVLGNRRKLDDPRVPIKDARAFISDSGDYLIFSGARGAVWFVDLAIMLPSRIPVSFSDPITAVAFTRAYIFLGSANGFLCKVKIEKNGTPGRLAYANAVGSVTSLAADATDQLLAIGTTQQGSIITWKEIDGEEANFTGSPPLRLVPLIHQDQVSQVSLVRDAAGSKHKEVVNVLTVSKDGKIRLFDASTGRERMRWGDDQAPDQSAYAAQAWPTGEQLDVLAVTRAGGVEGHAYAQEPQDKSPKEIEPAEAWFSDPDCQPPSVLAGNVWLANCNDQVVRDGAPKSGEITSNTMYPSWLLAYSVHQGGVTALWISKDGKTLTGLSGNADKPIHPIPLEISVSGSSKVQLPPDRLRLAVSADGQYVGMASLFPGQREPAIAVAEVTTGHHDQAVPPKPVPSFWPKKTAPLLTSLFLPAGCEGKVVLAGTNNGHIYYTTGEKQVNPSESSDNLRDLLQSTSARRSVVALAATPSEDCHSMKEYWAAFDNGEVVYKVVDGATDRKTELPPLLPSGGSVDRFYLSVDGREFAVVKTRAGGVGSDVYLFERASKEEFVLRGRLGSHGYFAAVDFDEKQPLVLHVAVKFPPSPVGGHMLAKETHSFNLDDHLHKICENEPDSQLWVKDIDEQGNTTNVCKTFLPK